MNPIQVAECAMATDIKSMPLFAWWAHHTLKKGDQIVSAMNKQHIKMTHKFGIEIPKTVQHALEIGKENGNMLWTDAVKKEKNVMMAFDVIDK